MIQKPISPSTSLIFGCDSKSAEHFHLGVPRQHKFSGYKHTLIIFSPLKIWLISCPCLCEKHSHPPRSKARSLGTLLTPPFSSPSQRFYYYVVCSAIQTLKTHLNTQIQLTKLFIIWLLLTWVLPFLCSFPFEFFVLAILNLERPSHTLLSLGLRINWPSCLQVSSLIVLSAQWTPIHSVRPN